MKYIIFIFLIGFIGCGDKDILAEHSAISCTLDNTEELNLDNMTSPHA